MTSWKLSCDEAGKTRKNVVDAIETLPVATGTMTMMWVITLLSFFLECAVIAEGWYLYRLEGKIPHLRKKQWDILLEQPKLSHLRMKQWAILTGLLLIPVLIFQFVYFCGFVSSAVMYSNIMATKEVFDTVNDCTDEYTVIDSTHILEPISGAYGALGGAYAYQFFIFLLLLCQIAVSGLHFASKIMKI
jgi:hypothetical protein